MSTQAPFVVSSDNVIVGTEISPRPAAFLVENGKISAVGIKKDFSPQLRVLDFKQHVVMSGLVDTHAHINEPGRTEWEGFATATRAAAAGGITTVVDMPLNSIPATTSLAALETKRAAAKNQCAIDYAFWGGVVPGNLAELEPMIRSGVAGFKCFLCPSGVDEFEHVSRKDLELAMPILAKHQVPLIVHAELEAPVPATQPSDVQEYSSYLASRPKSWEVDAIQMMITLARATGCKTHIVHLSAANAIPLLKQAQQDDVPITAETCPHYLALESEHIAKGATHFKCAPPIREHANREALWSALREGLLEFIVSDHSPCTPHLKLMETGNFQKAWGGISGLQFSLSVVWTEMRKRGFSISDLSRLMSYNTAKFLGITERKGSLKVGADADFVVFDPNASHSLQAAEILHRHKITPYLGQNLFGTVLHTYLRGQEIYARDSQNTGAIAPSGQDISSSFAQRVYKTCTTQVSHD